ncbi:hypothetical protein PV11_03847 [Exophiala sideris]|uniref:F-box domain-containing protein n=1 Tax=Exophiala sideris TaxID=1016849 RepID=A0A0D1YFK2_9EURO|nr:hypothetical protein PV11_03847 [Exophiala sideris]
MALRHPPRFPMDGEPLNDRYAFDNHGLDLTGRPLPDQSSVQQSEATSRKRPSSEDHLVVHSFSTDFGPKTLTRFLRDEISKLQSSIRSAKGKGKGRDFQQNVNPTRRLWAHPRDTNDEAGDSTSSSEENTMDHLPTGAVRSLLSTALNPSRRRSERLAKKEQTQPSEEVDAASGDISWLSQFTTGQPQSEDIPSSSSGDRRMSTGRRGLRQAKPNRSSSTSSTNGKPAPRSHTLDAESPRRVNFEEHTMNRRRAVRNIAIGESTEALENYRNSLRPPPRSRTVDDISRSSTSLPETSAGPSRLGLTSTRRPSLPAQARIRTSSRSRRRADDSQSAVSNSCAATDRKGKTANRSSKGGGETASKPEIFHLLDEMFSDIHLRRKRSPSRPQLGPVTVDGDRQTCQHPLHFDYAESVPENVSAQLRSDFLRDVQQVTGTDDLGDLLLMDELNEAIKESSSDATEEIFPVPFSADEPISAPPSTTKLDSQDCADNVTNHSKDRPATNDVRLASFDADVWMSIANFLSTEDIKNTRLVNQALANVLAPIQFRNMVINFDKSFFDVSEAAWDTRTGCPPSNSMLRKYGAVVNQFGIAFEYDLDGLTHAKEKIIEKEQVAWFGRFLWPTEQYPRYPSLQEIEDLVDHNRPLLKEAFKHVTKASELGLCIDSGHGWLEGPDISDLALFNRRMAKGSKVFGKTFNSEEVWTAFARNQYFKWAQQNTINEALKQLKERASSQEFAAKDIDFLEKLHMRDFGSFRRQEDQIDFCSGAHVGVFGRDHVATEDAYLDAFSGQDRSSIYARTQWPLIFNGYNLAAHLGGHASSIQNKTANPLLAPLLPGNITEAQAQWLMETVWAQRAFLSAYTTAVITNKQNFRDIHTLRISKLSSGLLPSLEQHEFWKSLPQLKTLHMLISPDWRQEYVIGDRSYTTNMLISPVKAARKFTQFLRTYIAKIESLHSLTIGYVGGGEHAVGMFARNQHVLPAPIVDDPRDWLRGVRGAMTKFDHIRDLKFENCWFTPWMLQGFMDQSKDTSLHSLTLESVSMVPYHEHGLDRRLTTLSSNLHCLHGLDSWLLETLPNSAAWCRVLDAITPGKTFVDRQYAAGILKDDDQPRPQKSFRGHVRKITLRSCGYVRITQPKSTQTGYNQNAAVSHVVSPMDKGIHQRKARFDKSFPPGYAEENDMVAMNARRRPSRDRHDDPSHNRVMLSTYAHGGEAYPWLGTLTQCVHPIEKRVLEGAWGMTFGWGDDMARWGAVEDGFFEGGTGRFSGVIDKDGNGHENDD